MKTAISEAVELVHDENEFIGGGRTGTVTATLDQLIATFGHPQPVESSDGKVTMRWLFKTPRGFAEVRDYWWNRPTEWSIAFANRKIKMWLLRFLKSKGITATNGARHV